MLKGYFKPATLDEARQALARHPGEATIVAGATDVYLDLKHGRKTAAYLVDVRGIPELRGIYEERDKLFIGAATTHAELAAHPAVRKHFAALAAGASAVGSPQIRQVGTVGGNIINAQPAADTAVPLFSFKAEAVFFDEKGNEHVRPIRELYSGPGISSLDSSKCILRGFYLPRGYFTASAFSRFAKRNALSLPILNLALAIRLQGDLVEDACLTAGPVARTPLRMTAAENALKGQRPDEALFATAAEAAAEEADPRDSLLRGSKAYRKDLLQTLVARILRDCCA